MTDDNDTPEPLPTSTVGRSKAVTIRTAPEQAEYRDECISLSHDNSLNRYSGWPSPTVIISDGAYGVLGFDGDTADHQAIPQWYEPHARAWSRFALPATTLWFWNSEIGWAAAHPVLEQCGFRYVNCNIWNKGTSHIAGNVNTRSIRRFPVVTEVCVQYVKETLVDGQTLKAWLLSEWKRSGLALREANDACGVKNAAVRKYFDQGHLWYFPPPEAMENLSRYANTHGAPEGRPYYSLEGRAPVTAAQWSCMRPRFDCPHGVTNVWERSALRGSERVTVQGLKGRAVHLNQKPLDLMERIIHASSEPGDVVWEPFGGLFSGCIAARRLGRRAFGAEIDSTYFQYGLARVKREDAAEPQGSLEESLPK